MQPFAHCEQELSRQGWTVIDLPDAQPVHAAKSYLLETLRGLDGFGEMERLGDYHRYIRSREQHFDVSFQVAQSYWQSQLGRKIVEKNLEVFRWLLGPDLLVQKEPYLRVVRPGQTRDATPLHRDTYYGASPFEVSVLVPFTEMTAGCGIRAIRGSHWAADSVYPFTQHDDPEVVLRSPKHQLGYPYAPRRLEAALEQQTESIPASVGQVVLLSLALVHGGGTNSGAETRFSTDIRVVNSWAPVVVDRGVRKEYFVPLSESVVTRIGRESMNQKQDVAR